MDKHMDTWQSDPYVLHVNKETQKKIKTQSVNTPHRNYDLSVPVCI